MAKPIQREVEKHNILKDVSPIRPLPMRFILQAMDIYAEKKAIEFINFVTPCDYIKDGDVYEIISNPYGFKNGNYTTKEVYNLHLEEEEKKSQIL